MVLNYYWVIHMSWLLLSSTLVLEHVNVTNGCWTSWYNELVNILRYTPSVFN